jgi:hypothetical protein
MKREWYSLAVFLVSASSMNFYGLSQGNSVFIETLMHIEDQRNVGFITDFSTTKVPLWPGFTVYSTYELTYKSQ